MNLERLVEELDTPEERWVTEQRMKRFQESLPKVEVTLTGYWPPPPRSAAPEELAIVALIHDIVIPTGIFAFLQIEIDSLFVSALLTVLGFSVHDTIVVFDRIRENLKKSQGAKKYADIVDESLRETLARSINTSLTTLLALVAIYFFGGQTTQNLALALILGILVGVYSSIFIASPLLVTIERRLRS